MVALARQRGRSATRPGLLHARAAFATQHDGSLKGHTTGRSGGHWIALLLFRLPAKPSKVFASATPTENIKFCLPIHARPSSGLAALAPRTSTRSNLLGRKPKQYPVSRSQLLSRPPHLVPPKLFSSP